ncbi:MULTISPECIES: hypothetical protein [Lacticaseibacillus]|uniref:Uncharacterized protein n=2 Tax=Lacticaseibacillus TaxID=2759736 RepID=A0AAN1EZJ0_LACCA|nr:MULTISPECIES: hypothetical protein [Lacticaseibacillus]ARY92055.1 hypothetical protein BGL52_09945 [Lacticaseibacillus casei]KAB1971105.1 hypothetical protein F9B82_01035 [Lacticaseibacillus casei]WLV79961.1 hypothetical protein LACSTY_002002 [Lacticaseibacillus sp. NCIMB 15473]WNX23921.1 hypothetical protein RWA15_09725 [Lacticaseibacillus casei]WNX26696.1 hypothetical protein RWA16_09730 [Lacticaseibacillus casei]
MAQIDAINQVINLVSLVVLLFAIVKTYRQVRSLNLLDYIIMYLKYRQTIYEEMQKNLQIRQKQLLSIAITLLIATFWVISSLQHLLAQWNFSNLLNALTTLGLLGLFLFQTWQTKHLNEDNRYLTFANHYQHRHFDDVLHIFQKKLDEWIPQDDADQRERHRFHELLERVKAEAEHNRRAAMFSDDLYALFDDKLLLHDGSEPLTFREKGILSYYVGYWDAGPYNDYTLGMLEDMDERERRIASRVVNVSMGLMAAGLIWVAVRQVVG